jgi:TIR domain/YEATS family
MIDHPICFISYSWDNESHKQWVLNLASNLMRNGIKVILDQWDLTPGMDISHFMEKSIRDAKNVLLVCTKIFAEKANSGTGGAGYEKLIVTGELFKSIPEQKKYVPLLREGEVNDSLPMYLQSKLYIDFRKMDNYQSSLERLVCHIYDIPYNIKPEIGNGPQILNKKGVPEFINRNSPTLMINIGNISKRIDERRWMWIVFVYGLEEDIEKINYVEYTLHDTFPIPVQIVSNRGKGKMAFALKESGWGTFNIFIRVFTKDGQILNKQHYLQFEE